MKLHCQALIRNVHVSDRSRLVLTIISETRKHPLSLRLQPQGLPGTVARQPKPGRHQVQRPVIPGLRDLAVSVLAIACLEAAGQGRMGLVQPSCASNQLTAYGKMGKKLSSSIGTETYT